LTQNVTIGSFVATPSVVRLIGTPNVVRCDVKHKRTTLKLATFYFD